MVATPTGAGYWLLASDGALFAFGDAPGIVGSNVEPLKHHVGDRRICGLVCTGPRSLSGSVSWLSRPAPTTAAAGTC